MAITATDVTLTGTLTDLQGNTLNGTLTFSLQGFGSTVPKIAGNELMPGIVFTATVSSGTFSVNFYSNQIITPGPLVTFYSIAFVATGNTNQVYNFAQNYQFSPGTFDLSQLTPLNAVISNTSLPNSVTPKVFTASNGQFLTGLTSSGNFTTGPTTLTLAQSNGVYGWSSGTASPLPAADAGISRLAAGAIAFGNGTAGDASARLAANLYQVGSGLDAGISRVAASTVGFGNGILGDVSGTVKAANFLLGGTTSIVGRNGVFSGEVGGNDLFFGHGNTQYVGAIGANNTSGLLFMEFYGYHASGTNVHNYASSSNLPLRLTVNDSGTTPNGALLIAGAPAGTVDTAITYTTMFQFLNNTTNPTLTFGTATGISQTGAGTLAIGNGAAGDASGTLKAAAINSASLVGASNGNTVTLLNIQGPTGSIAGTGAAVVMYTYTLPANTVGVGKAIRVTVSYNHTTGSATNTTNITLNGQNVLASAGITDASTQQLPNASYLQNTIYANAATTGVQMNLCQKSDGSSGPGAGTSSGLAWSSNQVINATFNVANTDAFTGRMFMVELIQ